MYKTEEYQKRLNLSSSANEFIKILIATNDLSDLQLEELKNYHRVKYFMQDLGFYSEFNIPAEWKKIYDFSILFYKEVERYRTMKRLVIDKDTQLTILGAMISLQKFVDVQKPMLDKLERERCIKEAFDYKTKQSQK